MRVSAPSISMDGPKQGCVLGKAAAVAPAGRLDTAVPPVRKTAAAAVGGVLALLGKVRA